MNKSKTLIIIKICVAIVVALTGVATCVFAILNMADISRVSANTVLRYLVGGILILVGVANTILIVFSKKPTKFMTILLSSVIVGVGIFLFLNESGSELTLLVSLAFPIIVACIGAAIFFKAIVDGLSHVNKRWLFELIIGVALIPTGVCFAVFHKNENLNNLIWLLLGIAIIVASIIAISVFIRQDKRQEELKQLR